MADYSILTTDTKFLAQRQDIDENLKNGIKIIAFCDQAMRDDLLKKRNKFVDAKLLQVFCLSEKYPSMTVIDGEFDEHDYEQIKSLGEKDLGFNFEQYLIEHAPLDRDIVVKAGAGTGKTTVMIDRVMFLMHKVSGLSFEDIGMITFTNEATQNMKHKIENMLLMRFQATCSARYIKWMEDVSRLKIQTIHSFSKDIISEVGASVGYGDSFALRSYKFEKRQLIHDVLNEKYLQNEGTVKGKLGAKLYELDGVLLDFWKKLDDLGLTNEEISSLDWGKADSRESKALHDTFTTSFSQLVQRYDTLKLEKDAIEVGDIIRELRKILDAPNEVVFRSKPLKYLFVDEFQDSDNAQINTIAWLKNNLGSRLFVVGDAKQSIYRFRGAVETAFERLETNIGKGAIEFTLLRNYRTSADILQKLDPMFRDWETNEMLDYGKSLIPQKKHHGSIDIRHVVDNRDIIRSETIKTLRRALQECCEDAREKGTEEDPTQRVTVLTRTNYELHRIGQWCEEEGIPCYIKKEGTLFISKAAMDFYCLLKACAFPNSKIHLFDLLESSYCPETIQIDEIYSLRHDDVALSEYLASELETIEWSKFQKELRFKPVISVIRAMIEQCSPVENYAHFRKHELESSREWKKDELHQQLKLDVDRYIADLEKILELIRTTFSGQMASIFQIYTYMKLNVLTNRHDDEPDISKETGCGCVYGMTVHKAKGLEFDTIILPFTNRVFRKEIDTEILIDESVEPKRVGWSHVVWDDQKKNMVKEHRQNDHYAKCLAQEFIDVDKEETRLLYVALTRCIRHLECFVIGNKEHSWAHFLEV